jgi:hypothetical protein
MGLTHSLKKEKNGLLWSDLLAIWMDSLEKRAYLAQEIRDERT